MNKVKGFVKNALVKYGHVIAGCAFAFVTIAANTQCMVPFYEPEEPEGLGKYQKVSK